MISPTSRDVLVSKDELLCYAATHADIHLGQQLSSGLTPSVVLWQQGHLETTTAWLALALKLHKCKSQKITEEKDARVQGWDREA